MGISQFNRSNPMVILMRRINDDFTNASLNGVKEAMRHILIHSIMQLAILVFTIVREITVPERLHARNLMLLAIIFFFLLVSIGFSFNATIFCGKNHRMMAINQMIYGDSYNIADVNNEDVLNIIADLKFMMGRLDATITLMRFWNAIIISVQTLVIVYLIRL